MLELIITNKQTNKQTILTETTDVIRKNQRLIE